MCKCKIAAGRAQLVINMHCVWRLILEAMLAQLPGHHQPHLCHHRLAQKVDLQLLLAAAQHSCVAVRGTL